MAKKAPNPSTPPPEQTLSCEINAEALREYAVYDTLVRRKRWISPAIFAAILSAFAAVCFAASKTRSGGILLGTVLLVIGLGLPVIYIGSYLQSVRRQLKKMADTGSKVMFTIRLAPQGITMTRGEQEQTWSWKTVRLVHRLRRSIAVYPEENQAFLIGGDSINLSAVWNTLVDRLPTNKIA